MTADDHLQVLPDETERLVATELGRRVKDLRRALGLTQTDLARKLAAYGVTMHQTTVAKLEGGTRPTTVHELLGLVRVLDCEPGQLLPPMGPPAADAELQRLTREVELAQVRVDRQEREYEEAVAELARVTQARDAAGRRYLAEVGKHSRGHGYGG